MSKKGILWTTFNVIIVILIILSVLIICFTFLSEGTFTESLEQAGEESKKIPDMHPRVETLCSKERLSDQMVIYVNSTPDNEENGYLTGLNKTNVTLRCEIPGTHEVSATCYINHFASWQWVKDGCDWVSVETNLGYFTFEIPDTTTTEKEFAYSCMGSDGSSNCNVACCERYKWYADMEKYYNKVNVVLNPVNSTKINVSYWEMQDWAGGSEDSCPTHIIYCGSLPFCYGANSYDFYGWGVEAKGKICCPPKEVRDVDGELVLDEEGDAVQETWVWDAGLEDGVCCLEESTEREVDYCENLHCEEKGGMWMYGRCWFDSSGTMDCNEICGIYMRADGSSYKCEPPDWERVEDNCDIQDLFTYYCDTCGPGAVDEKAPYQKVVSSVRECYYQDNPDVDGDDWCNEKSGSDTRFCSCV